MLNVVKNLADNVLTVKLLGSIDERSELDEILGKLPAELHLNCREIVRINSHGIRSWVKYFSSVVKNGTKLRFTELSPTLVQPMNLMANFIPASAVVESICLPYFCSGCKTQFISISSVAELAKTPKKAPDVQCPKCGKGTALFDDIESEYFLFLSFKKD